MGLNALDIGLTLYFVGIGGSRELNPVMVQILSLPFPLIIAYKVLLPAVLVTVLIAISRFQVLRKLNVKLILSLLVGAEAGICLFNLTGLIWR